MAHGGTRVPKRVPKWTKRKIYCIKYRQTETDGVIFGTISHSIYFRLVLWRRVPFRVPFFTCRCSLSRTFQFTFTESHTFLIINVLESSFGTCDSWFWHARAKSRASDFGVILHVSQFLAKYPLLLPNTAYYANWLSIVYGLKDRLLKNLLVFFAENRRFNVFNLSLSSNEGKKRKMALFCSETSGSRR